MRNVKNTIADKILSLVAPHPCFNCGVIGRPLCDNCKKNIISQRISVCPLCGSAIEGYLCPNHDLPYSALCVGGARRGSLQLLIGAFKFRFMLAALDDVVDILEASIPVLPPETVVVPVPTLAAHIRQRGYDHALLLAEAFARRRGLKVDKLVERSGVAVQHRLKRAQRIEAAKHAFSVLAVLDPNTPYLIVDDIFTTGATVAAVAMELRKAGAREVWVAVVAYQPIDSS